MGRVHQPAHNFTRGTCVRLTPSGWVRATTGSQVDAVVAGIHGADVFEALSLGTITLEPTARTNPGAYYGPDADGELAETGSPRVAKGSLNGNGWEILTLGAGSSSSQPATIGIAGPGWLSASPPITGSGTLSLTAPPQPLNTVLAAPSAGGAGTPVFRVLAPSDIPNLSLAYQPRSPVLDDVASQQNAGKIFAGPVTGADDYPGFRQAEITDIHATGSAGATTFLAGDAAWKTAVTSVGLSAPAIFAVTGSPVTTTGTLALTLEDQQAGYVWAGPVSGPDDEPLFRALAATDIPDLSAIYQPADSLLDDVSGLSSAGFLVFASGAITTQAVVNISDINATGTPSASTYLRGDGAWVTPSAYTPPSITMNRLASGDGAFISDSSIADGVSGGVLTFAAALTAARTVTVPDVSLTVAGQNISNTFSVMQGIGTTPTAGNGLLQLAGGTTRANGIYFGGNEYLFRAGSGHFHIDAGGSGFDFKSDFSGPSFQVISQSNDYVSIALRPYQSGYSTCWRVRMEALIARLGTTADGSTWTEQLEWHTGNCGTRFVPQATPAAPQTGSVYYDSTTDKLRCYNGSTWQDLF